MSVPALKRYIDVLEKMGYNRLMLYTEDTYELDGEPLFGYMRGRYSKSELKEIDAYALSKGIELVPCIQTLAHLNQIFDWTPYQSIRDVDDILLLGEEKTYALIDKMFKTCSECFTSRKIHIGMDEAFMLGFGAYRRKHGITDRHELFLEHLNKVCEMANGYGLSPMMWSDMFFQLAFNKYYVGKNEGEIPQWVRDKAPKNVELVYWDYYAENKDVYSAMMEKHLDFDNDVSFAGGTWKWTGFLPSNVLSIRRSELALRTCNEHGIKNVMTTLWGDDGDECPVYATLPALFHFAECARGNYDLEDIKKKFEKIFNENFDDFMALDMVFPEGFDRRYITHNGSKVMFYNDPFIGKYDSTVYGTGAEAKQYAEFAKIMKRAKERSVNYKYIFEHFERFCEFLEVKYDLGYNARMAYKNKDRKALKNCVKNFKEAERRLNVFHAIFEKTWLTNNKPFGFEIQEIRIGGLMLRLKTCRKKLQDYIAGKIDNISELEVELTDFYGAGDKLEKLLPDCSNYQRISSVNRH